MTDRMWRPWRMAYIKGPRGEGDCFLCDCGAAASRDRDHEHLVLGRGSRVFAILNRYPYNTGHLMVAPYRHVGDPGDLDEAETLELWAWVNLAVAAHRRATQPHGFNIGINLGAVAGAGVPGHLHVHVVPRWGGDTNFMPVIAETKVMPEMLEDTYATLLPAFADLSAPS